MSAPPVERRALSAPRWFDRATAAASCTRLSSVVAIIPRRSALSAQCGALKKRSLSFIFTFSASASR